MKKQIGIISLILSAIIISACGSVTDAQKEAEGMTGEITSCIENNGADPWVIRQNGTYYYSKSVDGRIELYRSQYLTDISAGESCVIWRDTPELNSFWAPELHFLDGAWYVYVAAATMQDDIHRTYVLKNTSADPFTGKWECMPMKGWMINLP